MTNKPIKTFDFSGQPFQQKAHASIWALFFLTAAVTAFCLSGTAPPGLDIDKSWQAALEYASFNGWQFGTDIVFTHGPLNYLDQPVSQGFLLPQRAVFAFIWSIITAASATLVATRLSGLSRLFFAVWFLFFSLTGRMEQHFLIILACGAALLLENRDRIQWAHTFYLPIMAIISLIKFNFFIACAITIAVISTVHLLRRSWLPAVQITAIYSGFFLLFWSLCSQKMSSLLPWLRGSLEITSGYSEAMLLPPDTGLLFFCVMLMVLLFSALFLISRGCSRNLIIYAQLLLLSFYAFLSWKHGIVRSGGEHTLNFVIEIPVIFGLLLAIQGADKSRKTQHKLTALYLLAIILSVATAEMIESGAIRSKLCSWPALLTGNLHQIYRIASGNLQENYPSLHSPQSQREPDLPLARKLIGNAKTDVLNSFQWSAFANGLNYRPRPVIQGYSVYTPYLQQLNLQFFRSANRPDFLLINPDSIDGRLESMDDATSLLFIFSNYQPIGKDGDFAILKTASAVPVEPRLTPLTEMTIGFNQTVDLSHWQHSPLVMQVTMTKTAAGLIMDLLYQPPVILIKLHTGKRGIMASRFVPKLGRAGFIVSPVISNADDIISLYRGSWQAVTGVEFCILNPLLREYSEKINLRLSRLDLPLSLPVKPAAERAAVRQDSTD